MGASVQHARLFKASKLEVGLGVAGIRVASVTINFYCGITSCVLITLWDKQKSKYCKDSDGHNHRNEQVSSERAKVTPSTPPAQLLPTTLPGKSSRGGNHFSVSMPPVQSHHSHSTTATKPRPRRLLSDRATAQRAGKLILKREANKCTLKKNDENINKPSER